MIAIAIERSGGIELRCVKIWVCWGWGRCWLDLERGRGGGLIADKGRHPNHEYASIQWKTR